MDGSVEAEWQAAPGTQMVVEVIPLHRLLFMLRNTGSWVRMYTHLEGNERCTTAVCTNVHHTNA